MNNSFAITYLHVLFAFLPDQKRLDSVGFNLLALFPVIPGLCLTSTLDMPAHSCVLDMVAVTTKFACEKISVLNTCHFILSLSGKIIYSFCVLCTCCFM